MCIHKSTLSELDCLFSPSHHVGDTSNTDEVIQQFVSVMSNAYNDNKEKVSVEEDIRYGDGEVTKVDVWGRVDETMIVMIHGGYWQEGDRKYITTCVPRFVEKGIAVACVGYGLASAERPLSVLIQENIQAVKKLFEKYPRCSKFVLAGHSAGGHLAYKTCSALKSKKIIGLCLFASIFELQELVGTYIGEPISLSLDDAQRSSCCSEEMRDVNVPIRLISAEFDAPKLQEQGAEMFVELRGMGVDVQQQKIPGTNHFSLMEQLAEDSIQTRILLRLFEDVVR